MPLLGQFDYEVDADGRFLGGQGLRSKFLNDLPQQWNDWWSPHSNRVRTGLNIRLSGSSWVRFIRLLGVQFNRLKSDLARRCGQANHSHLLELAPVGLHVAPTEIAGCTISEEMSWGRLQIGCRLTVDAHTNGFEMAVEKAFHQFQLHHAYGKLASVEIIPRLLVLILQVGIRHDPPSEVQLNSAQPLRM